MAKLGGWWLSSEPLDDDEVVLEKYPTNYFENDRRPYGGRLYVTDKRLVFLPHILDALFGASRLSVTFDAIEDVASEADRAEIDHEVRRIPIRLRIETVDEAIHQFVVDDLEDVLAVIEDVMVVPNSAD